MAKIISVALKAIPQSINVGDSLSDFTVVTKIAYHPKDIEYQMLYGLHLFVYDMQGEGDAPIITPNWDEAVVHTFAKDSRYDDFLGKAYQELEALEPTSSYETKMTCKLGNIKKSASYSSRHLRVFATIAPAIGRASKWSEPFETNLFF